ncbi:MAG: SDR family oxidoreductase [Candidatus Latescibacteria bacterium]|nr:SDR family oxidoreductase [Candidatus Latescibacterota bacterium]
MRLQNKIAIITGASTGIGRASAVLFAQEGARVVVADINDDGGRQTIEVIRKAGGEAEYVHTDVSQSDQVQTMVARAVEVYGGVDILFNNAAYLHGYHPVHTMPEVEWRVVMSVTLDGVFLCSKYAIPEMLKRGGGSIINTASVEGVMGVKSHCAYVTAKSALFGLTKSMAIDYGPHGIRVNAISPGIIDSGRPDQEEYKKSPAHVRWWRDMTVLDRMGRVDEIARTALFLASDESSYLTGQNIIVDGGWVIGHPPFPAEGAR